MQENVVFCILKKILGTNFASIKTKGVESGLDTQVI